MSHSWHISRLAASGQGEAAFGFYDSAHQIALFPDQGMHPDVTVDHEITHVTIVMDSSLGLLERALVWLGWIARQSNHAEGDTHVRALWQELVSATDGVHEAAAWFGTELQTEGRENLSAPEPYTDNISRLRRLFARMPDKPFDELAQNFALVMRIADDIAIYTLCPPVMAALWAHPERITPETLRADLRRETDNPSARFRQICSRLEGVPFREVDAWSRAMEAKGSGGENDARRALPAGRSKFGIFRHRAKIPAVFGADLPRRDTVRALRALALRIGLFDAGPVRLFGDAPSIMQPDDDAIERSWVTFRMTHGFQHQLDRYSQVCVLPQPTLHLHRKNIYHDEPALVAPVFGRFRYLAVSLTSAGFAEEGVEEGETTPEAAKSQAMQFEIGRDEPSHVKVQGPNEGFDRGQCPIRPTWYVDVSTVRAFLQSYGTGKPIIASSGGYDFGEGDYEGVNLLKDIPHVVVTIRDFRSLWLGLARGLGGCRSIEWRAMPSPSDRKYFGFLLFKPAAYPFPIVVNPTLVSHYDRAVTAADRLPFKGVRLIEDRGNPYQWLGAMTHAVITAASVFETGFQ